MILRRLLAALALFCAGAAPPHAAEQQAPTYRNQTNTPVSAVGVFCVDLAGNYVGCGGSGGGGSTGSVNPPGTAGTQAQTVQGNAGGIPFPLSPGAATAANQGLEIAALGTPSDAAYSGSGSGSNIALGKGQYAILSLLSQANGAPADAAAPTGDGSQVALQKAIRNLLAGTLTISGTVAGNVASGAADSGNPVKIGCVYTATSPTLTTGQRGDVQCGPFGQINTTSFDTLTQVGARVLAATTDNQQASGGGAVGNARPFYFNGTGWDRARDAATAARTAGLGVGAVNPVPVTNDVGITQAFNNGSTNALSAKGSAGNLYGFGGTMGATAGFLALVNAATTPAANAAITPIECITMAAGASFRSTPQIIPYRYTAGIQVLATTSCTTFTAPANAAVNLNAAVQ